ncbi:MAG: glycoside hydrolase 5 family protein [Sphingomonadaceae bacterium]
MEIEETSQIRLVASAPRPFVLGINYWPRKKAMYWWKQFDAGEVRSEFAEIAALGSQVVRIFLMWEDFQPEPWSLDSRRLDDLIRTMDAAHEAGLGVMPTFFTGNMSGIFWLPPWAMTDRPRSTPALTMVRGHYSDREPRDLFEEPFMLRAELFQLRVIVPALATHPALFGWDLANELDEVRNPESYHGGWLWSYLLAEEVRKLDPSHSVTYGAHTPSLSRYNGLSVGDLAESNDYLSMHGYPLYSDVARGPLDSDFVPFLNQLTESLGAKPTLFQEFGLCTAPPGQSGTYIEDEFLGEMKRQYLASEEEAGQYYREVLEKLYLVGSLGAFPWCFSDYDPALWDSPPFDRAVRERSFGLTRADGSLKPAALEYQRFARRLKSGELKGWGSEKLVLPVSTPEYYEDPSRHFQEQYRWYLRKKGQEVTA